MATRRRAATPKPIAVSDKLLKALSEVDRPGDFCTYGDRPLVMPGLEVDKMGVVGLPLTKPHARKLIKLCRQAPYGKGTETVVDTDVRRVWELDPAQFQLTNPKWDEFIASIVDDVKETLGLGRQKLVAHLYKLLVYEKGSFFLPHRDGEKLDRMVATLVVGLPAVHEGGELVVSHDGRSHEVIFKGAAGGHELSYAAFYADCQHEVRPVRSGYRLCLTYNLTLAGSRGKQGIAAPSYELTAAAIGKLLGDWSKGADDLRLAVTLDHRYTQDGLSIDKLKGVDRAAPKSCSRRRNKPTVSLIWHWSRCGRAAKRKAVTTITLTATGVDAAIAGPTTKTKWTFTRQPANTTWVKSTIGVCQPIIGPIARGRRYCSVRFS